MPCLRFRSVSGRAIRISLSSFAGGMQASRSGLFTGQILAYSIAEWVDYRRRDLVSAEVVSRKLRTFSVVDSAVFIGFVAFGSIVQIPGIGGGMQVASVVILTELFGVDFAAATGVAILIWLTMYVFVAPIGVLLAVHEGLKWRELRHIDTERLS